MKRHFQSSMAAVALPFIAMLTQSSHPTCALAQAASSETVEEQVAIEIGQRLTIKSNVLNQKREYLVYLPASYDANQYLPQSYPVLFLFDGNVQFHLVTGMVDYMAKDGWQIPELIIVGITQRNRTHELTPTRSLKDFRVGKTTQQNSDSGGGEAFLQFITEELIPKIDADYRTRPYRILFGHSYGGLLAAHAFIKNDDAFNAFILADPSLWWDDRVVLRMLEEVISSGGLQDRQTTMFVSNVPAYLAPGDQLLQQGFKNIEQSVRNFGEKLKQVESIRLRAKEFDAETHHSLPVQTLYHGLRHVFDGYELPPEYFLSMPEKIEERFRELSEDLGLRMLPREQLIDMWGMAFLNYDEDFRKHAFPLLELNTKHYPASPNAHASLGTAYAAVAKTSQARAAFEKAIELDPGNKAATEGLETLLK
ncbi:MAG: alpha/beta hydrolase-fold protein [Planctomycetota bacterium]